MPTDSEPELLLPDGMSAGEAEAKLAGALSVTLGEVTVAERTFYDTFDGLLHAAGTAFVYEDGALALVDPASGAPRVRDPVAARPERLLASDLPSGTLRDAVAKLADVRALLPIATVSSERSTVGVLDDNAKIIVRIEFERPSLIASSRRRVALRPRLRPLGVRGYGDELARVRKVLAKRLGARPADLPLVDEAVAAAGRQPAGVSSKVEVALKGAARADAAAVAVLSRLMEVIEVNLPGTVADVDAEFLHDLRVAVRRSRSVQRELKAVFPAEQLAFWRGELRWLQQATGSARDMDVYVLDFEEFRDAVPEPFRADLDPLLTVLRSHRLAARREMVRALRSDRAVAALDGWRGFLQTLEALPLDGRPDATRPIAAVAAERIRKVYRQMLRMGGAIDDASPPSDYHELRKKGKELRYLLELFGAPLFDAGVVGPMVKSLKALQDTLGRHQDREVQVDTLRSLTGAVSALPGGARALMAMGLLVDRLGQDERAARAEFAERFAAFASKQRRKAVAKAFST